MTEAPKLEKDDNDPASEKNDELKKDSYGEFYHKPAENIRDKLQVKRFLFVKLVKFILLIIK